MLFFKLINPRLCNPRKTSAIANDANFKYQTLVNWVIHYLHSIIAGLMQRGYSRTANVSDKDNGSSKSSNKDNFKKQRGF